MSEDVTIPDDCLAEIVELAPDLTAQERKYVYWRSIGSSPGEAFDNAGYKGNNARAIETRPKVRRALQDLNERLEPEYRVTQQKVIGLIMEGIDIARRNDQAKTIIEGAVALAGVAGVDAATKIQVDSKTTGIIQHEHRALQHLPRTGLEQMVGIQRALQAPIEGEYQCVN